MERGSPSPEHESDYSGVQREVPRLPHQDAPDNGYEYYPQGGRFAEPGERWNGLAIASISCGGGALILAFFGFSSFCCSISMISALCGIIFGIVAISQINKDPYYKGRELAWAGLIMGISAIVLALLIVLFVIFLYVMLIVVANSEESLTELIKLSWMFLRPI
jgi:hypothetical protein